MEDTASSVPHTRLYELLPKTFGLEQTDDQRQLRQHQRTEDAIKSEETNNPKLIRMAKRDRAAAIVIKEADFIDFAAIET